MRGGEQQSVVTVLTCPQLPAQPVLPSLRAGAPASDIWAIGAARKPGQGAATNQRAACGARPS